MGATGTSLIQKAVIQKKSRIGAGPVYVPLQVLGTFGIGVFTYEGNTTSLGRTVRGPMMGRPQER
jgi:hypothetical protein